MPDKGLPMPRRNGHVAHCTCYDCKHGERDELLAELKRELKELSDWIGGLIDKKHEGLARIHKLERVVEAAKRVDAIYKCEFCESGDCTEDDWATRCWWCHLHAAIAAAEEEEVSDGDLF